MIYVNALMQAVGQQIFQRITTLKQTRLPNRILAIANVAFCDGHVESPTLQFLFADTSDAALSRWNRDHQPHRERLAP